MQNFRISATQKSFLALIHLSLIQFFEPELPVLKDILPLNILLQVNVFASFIQSLFTTSSDFGSYGIDNSTLLPS